VVATTTAFPGSGASVACVERAGAASGGRCVFAGATGARAAGARADGARVTSAVRVTAGGFTMRDVTGAVAAAGGGAAGGAAATAGRDGAAAGVICDVNRAASETRRSNSPLGLLRTLSSTAPPRSTRSPALSGPT